jgi:UDPglucose 6-dehydrogenase
MKVVVVGTGYVGLVTGTCLAEVGIDVICVDIDIEKVENLKKGIIPIYEPGLEPLVVKNLKNQRLRFSSTLKDCIDGADVIFIAVGTPPGEDGSADLKYVIGVAEEIGQNLTNYCVITTKSTVPVGTAKIVESTISAEINRRDVSVFFDVASNPEFLKEGAAIEDFLKPDRIVVGVSSSKAEEIMRKLYKPFLLNGHPIIFMDVASADVRVP